MSQPKRVPPPCWTHEETQTLLQTYKQKWYSLNRSNLKASHWDEFTESIPTKTPIQCRHKMEKIRQRYKAEKQRLINNHEYKSNWIFFKRMDSIEHGGRSVSSSPEPTQAQPPILPPNYGDGYGYGYDPLIRMVSNEDLHPPPRVPTKIANSRTRRPKPVSNITEMNINNSVSEFRNGSRYTRFKSAPVSSFGVKSSFENGSDFINKFSVSRRFDDIPSFKVVGGVGKGQGMDEMVKSIRMLGEGYMKIEEMKIEAAREIMELQMEIDMKRTEMFCEAQLKIVEALTKGVSGMTKVTRKKEKGVKMVRDDCEM